MATFFTDADTGPHPGSDIPRVLKEAGLNVVCHDERFRARTPDYEWLKVCGAEGMIAITKDQQIRYCWRAKLSIMRSGAKLFVLVAQGKTHPELGHNLVNSAKRVTALASRHDGPLIARVYWPGDERYKNSKPGEVKQWLTHEQWLRLERQHDEAIEAGGTFRSKCR